MSPYSTITIIYNPNSTGPGKRLAEELASSLRPRLPDQKVDVTPTQHAGHAETLAYELARGSKNPLIISASGDGGYNEVVNGLMRAKNEGANPTAGLLPAGNANDHFHNLHEGNMAESIMKGNGKDIDLLVLKTIKQGKSLTRYAHSYIGVGLTPKVGQELNKTSLNFFKEAWIVLKVLFFLQPVQLRVDGKTRTYDSLIFSNVKKMSKVLSIAKHAEVDDDRFEVTTFYRRNKFKLIASLLRATTKGLRDGMQTKQFSFQTLRPVLIQLDGEILMLEAGSRTIITLEHAVLPCIV